MPSASLLVHTDDAHVDVHTAAPSLTLLVFSGKWCPPCRAMEPVLEALALDRRDVTIVELDVDESQRTAERLGVRSVPALFLVRGGRVLGQRIGGQTRRQLDAWLAATPQV